MTFRSMGFGSGLEAGAHEIGGSNRRIRGRNKVFGRVISCLQQSLGIRQIK